MAKLGALSVLVVCSVLNVAVAAQENGNPIEREVPILEICNSFITRSSNDSKLRFSCFNSGLTPTLEVVEPKIWPALGVVRQARVGEEIYREDLRLKMNVAVLTSPLEVGGDDVTFQLAEGTEFQEHMLDNGRKAYCWFDVKQFNEDELHKYRYRKPLFAPPPFETVCLGADAKQGSITSVLHHPAGEFQFKRIDARAKYESEAVIVAPHPPEEMPVVFAEFSRRVSFRAMFPEGAQVVFANPDSAIPDVFLVPLSDGEGQRSIRGIEITISSASEDEISYSVTGGFKPWAEVVSSP